MIEAALGGDAGAERALYDSHVDRVFRLAFRMTGDRSLAEEFTQETFIRVFDRLAGFRRESALSTWIHRIALSVILNGLRRWKRIREREGEMSEGIARSASAAPRREELRIAIERLVDRLPEDLRVVFVMHDVEGYRHREIGGILDMPVGTSKAKLHRARAALRDGLAEAGFAFNRAEES